MTDRLLEVERLTTQFRTESGPITAVDGVSFGIDRGEVMGLVGESGAGKSVTARSILRLIDPPGEIVDGEVRFKGEDLLEYSAGEMRSVRGNEITLIPQDPMTSLNPVMTVGEQITEAVRKHQGVSRKHAREIAIDAMKDVEIPDPETRIDEYPSEFSGGMRQRVLIAIGLACEPELIIADEPTTAIDVTTQAKILELLDDLRHRKGVAILIITHNLGVVAQTCDDVGVMYAGNLVEKGPIEELFDRPKHPYTRGLLDSIPAITDDRDRLHMLSGSMPAPTDLPLGCNFAPRCAHATEECLEGGDPPLDAVAGSSTLAACHHADRLDLREPDIAAEHDRSGAVGGEESDTILEVSGLKKHFSASDGLLGGLSMVRPDGGLPRLERRSVKAVDGVSFSIDTGETVGLVGESGCGKSTVARTILRLLKPTEGEIHFDGRPLHELSKRELIDVRKDIQIIFQDPKSSLNPRKPIGRIIGRSLEKHDIATGVEKRKRVEELLERVGLQADDADKFPHQFSGGQQQRIAIANALAVEPKLIVCDEPVSALDVSVQAQVLNLLSDIQDEFGISYLFISHNIAAVKYISDKIAVMYLGKIAEYAPTADVFSPPYHPYTESLLSAVPRANPFENPDRILLEGTVPSPIDPPSGCPFHTRCPKKIGDVCETDAPTLQKRDTNDKHHISCHLSESEMSDSDLGAIR